jgi:sulfatase maturation enzyme AslB (radical SAM superfamily)
MLSKNMVFMDVNSHTVAYNRIVGNLAVLTPEQKRILIGLTKSAQTSAECPDALEEFCQLGFISGPHSADSDTYIHNRLAEIIARPQLIENLNGLLLKVIDGCNFRCSYCIDSACMTANDLGSRYIGSNLHYTLGQIGQIGTDK